MTGPQSGVTSADQQAQLLADYSVATQVEEHGTIESLANDIQEGHGVILSVNADVLWNTRSSNDNAHGIINHAITVIGVERDPATGQIQGFDINDSGDGHTAQFVSAQTLQEAWVDATAWPSLSSNNSATGVSVVTTGIQQ